MIEKKKSNENLAEFGDETSDFKGKTSAKKNSENLGQNDENASLNADFLLKNQSETYANKRQKIVRKSIQAADGLSLGISIVVAVLLGIGLGLLLKKYTPYEWLFWLGVIIGIGGAISNIFKAYKAQVASYDEFAKRDEFLKGLKKEQNAK